MTRRTGSWPFLLAAALAFLGAFALLRQRSTFLAIERAAPAAAALATRHAVPRADVLALHDLLGADAGPAALDRAVAAYAAQRQRTGDPFAAMLATGPAPDAVAAALAAAPDPATAWQRFAVGDPALPGLRFLELRRRFAERAAARD